MHIVWLNMAHGGADFGMFMIHVLSFQLEFLIMVIYKEWI